MKDIPTPYCSPNWGWKYDPELSELTNEERNFWSAVVFVHQETSDIEFGIQGEPGWQQALELVLSGYSGARWKWDGGFGWTEDYTWQTEITTDRARNQVVSRFLNAIGLLTPNGRRRNQENWKSFVNALVHG